MAASLSDIEEFLAGPLVKWVTTSLVYVIVSIEDFSSSAFDVRQKT